ncbi:MAG TPA: alpha/beta hydrolase [Stellaceae bacterium]|nr:alpha/beta hydrolase [Stellaceae bacterium]
MRPIAVTAPDGLAIAAGEWGNPAGAEILFIHGFSQSLLSWTRQLDDPELARKFRMVAYDLRGHGASDKPLRGDAYLDARLWGDEVASVIAAAGLKRPVLVGWSYGGRVISDYVRVHGIGGIAGINFVAAVTKSADELRGPALKAIAGLVSDDLAANIRATRSFLRAIFATAPEAGDFETMLAFNMVVPAKVRAMIGGRAPEPGDMLARLTLPVLVTHGTEDRLILPAMGRFTAASVPGATLSLYDGIGHAPFFEDAPRFNRELAAFAASAQR